jgi:hypothetical protein
LLASNTAVAPSFNEDEFPAVTVPPFLNAADNPESFSVDVSFLGCSSFSTYDI